jgi:hypothetical protein
LPSRNTAHSRDGGETPAGFIVAVPGSDRLFDLLDPFLEIAELIGHRLHGDPGFRQEARVIGSTGASIATS